MVKKASLLVLGLILAGALASAYVLVRTATSPLPTTRGIPDMEGYQAGGSTSAPKAANEAPAVSGTVPQGTDAGWSSIALSPRVIRNATLNVVVGNVADALDQMGALVTTI